MIRGFLTGILLILCGVLIHLGWHLGVLKPVSVTEEVRGPYYLLYKNHVGAYFQISDVISNVENQAKQNSFSCDKTFGQYFDNPKEVEEDRLHSRGGCVSSQPYDHHIKGLDTDSLPKKRYVVATFAGSPAIGPWKVYPKIQAYLDAHRLHAQGNSVEIYTLNGDQITTEYLMTLQ